MVEYHRDPGESEETADMTIADVVVPGIYEIEESGSGYTEEYLSERERESGGSDEVDEPPAATLTITAWGEAQEWGRLNELRSRDDPFPVSVGPFVFEEMGITNLEQTMQGQYKNARQFTIELQEFREVVVQERSMGGGGSGDSSDGGGAGDAPGGGPSPENPEYSGSPTTVPAGAHEEFQVDDGETWGGELIDVSADGASAQVLARGGSWTIENVGLRGTFNGRALENGDSFMHVEPTGESLINNVYMGDGAAGRTEGRDTGIFVNPESSGDLTIRNINAQGWPDNAIYASAPHESGSGNMAILIEDSYSANNQTSCYRLGQGTIQNCVGLRDGNGTRGNRVVWARAPGPVEIVDSQIANRQNGAAVMLGNGGSSTANIRGDSVIEGGIQQDGGGSANFSGNAREGDADTSAYPDSVPGSAADAAEGRGSTAGGGGGSGSGGSGGGSGGGSSGGGDISIDFEGASSPGDVYDNVGSNTGITSSVASSGSQSLYHHTPSGTSGNSNTDIDLTDRDYGQPQAVTNQFDVRCGDSMAFNNYQDNVRIFNCGLNTMYGNAHSGGDGPPSGDDGWSVRLYIMDIGNRNGPFGLVVYVYHLDQSGSAGDSFRIEDPLFQRGQWHTVESTVEMNSVSGGSANADGTVRVSVDGSEVYSRGDFRWTTIEEQAHQRVGPATRWGGSEVPPNDTDIYFDNHDVIIG